MALIRNSYGQVDIRDGQLPDGFVLLDELPASESDLTRVEIEFAPALRDFREGRPVIGWLVASDWLALLRPGDVQLARELRRAGIIRRGRRLGLPPTAINNVLRNHGYTNPDELLCETSVLHKRKKKRQPASR